MNEHKDVADWGNISCWLPLFLKRNKAKAEIIELEAEKQKIRNSPLSKEETKERLKNGEIEHVARDIAIKCSTGEDLNFLVNKKQAVELCASATLIAEARKAVDEIDDADWPQGAKSEDQKQDEILRCDFRIDKLEKDLDLKKIGNKRLIIHNELGEPIAFRPDDWVEDLANEIRQKGPTHNTNGDPNYTPEKLKAIGLITAAGSEILP